MNLVNRKTTTVSEHYSFKIKAIKVHVSHVDVSNAYSNVPKGRSGHRIVANDTFLYTFGGYNPDLGYSYNDVDSERNTLFKELWEFNLVTKTWRLLNILVETFPNELASTAVELVGNVMLIHGGTGIPFGTNSSNTTLVVNLVKPTSLIPLKTTGTPPTPMYGQGIAVDEISRKLYLVGGTSGTEFFMDVHYLDLNNLTWNEIKVEACTAPDGRYRHEIALYDSKILVFGGGTLAETYNFKTLPELDLKTGRWDTVCTEGHAIEGRRASFPTARRCHAGVMIPESQGRDAQYIICGGFNGHKALSDIWSLNLRKKKWTKWKTTLPRPLHFHDAAVTPQGKLFIFGGIADRGRLTIRTNEVLSCWAVLPTLAEIAWEALIHYVPKIPQTSHEELLALGVPRCFVDRVGVPRPRPG